ncbi:MAG: haloacid dehalogenase-like hydrolase [Eubacterium sp.]|nr:haloacid dehalogenase-like hydrolase [Eubacterium sp.]
MEEIDIYDFDKTIVPFDSGSLFVIYCVIHYPWILICLPIISVTGLLKLLKLISFTTFKKSCFMFVPLIPIKKAVKKFWDKYEEDVFDWWLEKDKRNFVVISASPDFLLEDISERLSFNHLISTRHNKRGIIIGQNCRGEEKVRRFNEMFQNVKVVDVFSDSFYHDKPIFSLATGQCYHINEGKVEPFDFKEQYKEES